MIPGRGRVLGLFAFVGVLIGTAAGDVGAQASGPNIWTTVAPLPEGLLWPAGASAAGKLYVFGVDCSSGSGSCNNTYEAYDPHTNAWTAMGDMPETLGSPPSATTGTDGRIYLCFVPGDGGSGVMLVYDPRANSWSHAPPPPRVRDSVSLVTGINGRIYAVADVGVVPSAVITLSAFDPRTHKWTRLASDPTPRYGPPVAAVGPDGRIYVIGGDKTFAKVEAYDPQRNAWTSVAPLPSARSLLQAVTGPDGRIYVLGGMGRCFTAPCNEVEAYDVHTKAWTSVTPLPHGRWQFVAVVGPDGRIYVIGGYTTPYITASNLATEVDSYTVVPGDQPLPPPPPRPATATRKLASMPTARYGLGATTSGGKIYAIGGQAVLQQKPRASPPPTPPVLRTVEAYDPKTNSWAAVPPLPAPRMGMGVATGPDGRIYVLGGVAVPWNPSPSNANNELAGLRSVEIYDPRTHHWSRGRPMPDGRYALAAVTGTDGRIYTIGGTTICVGGDLMAARIVRQAQPARSPLQVPGPPPPMPGGSYCKGTQSVRAFNPRTNTWTTLAPLHVGRLLPAAAVARDGRIYVFGGDSPPFSRSFEMYDPGKNRWSKVAGLPRIRINGFVAGVAGDGRIDLMGGCLAMHVTRRGFYAYCGSPNIVDAYDPRTNAWTKIGVTLNARQALAGTTGPNGQVYAVGGAGDGNGKLLEVIRQGRRGSSSAAATEPEPGTASTLSAGPTGSSRTSVVRALPPAM